MDINSVGKSQSAYARGVSKQRAEDKITDQPADNASDKSEKVDTFEKSPQYKPDIDKVNAMKLELANNVSAFKQMVQGAIQKQGGFASDALSQLMEIDEATQLEAQEAISENGEWGIEATATRILDFAKAISGGDPDKIPMLRQAVENGFAAAEEVWGGSLPDLCYQTRDRIMEGFDQWAKDSQPAAETNKADAAG